MFQAFGFIRTYISRIRPKAQAELDWFARQPSLHAAIEKAALSKNSRDKRYSISAVSRGSLGSKLSACCRNRRGQSGKFAASMT
jgi:hypothetical protein